MLPGPRGGAPDGEQEEQFPAPPPAIPVPAPAGHRELKLSVTAPSYLSITISAETAGVDLCSLVSADCSSVKLGEGHPLQLVSPRDATGDTSVLKMALEI